MKSAALKLASKKYSVQVIPHTNYAQIEGQYVEFSYPVTGFVTHNAPEGIFGFIADLVTSYPTSGVYISHNLTTESSTVWEKLYDDNKLTGDYDETYDELVAKLIENEIDECRF